MNCQTCNVFGELQAVGARLKPQVPGLRWTINACLAWHLSVMHGVSYQDLGTETSHSPDMHTAAIGVRASPEGAGPPGASVTAHRHS